MICLKRFLLELHVFRKNHLLPHKMKKKSSIVFYLIGITSTKNGSLHDRITGEYFL